MTEVEFVGSFPLLVEVGPDWVRVDLCSEHRAHLALGFCVEGEETWVNCEDAEAALAGLIIFASVLDPEQGWTVLQKACEWRAALRRACPLTGRRPPTLH